MPTAWVNEEELWEQWKANPYYYRPSINWLVKSIKKKTWLDKPWKLVKSPKNDLTSASAGPGTVQFCLPTIWNKEFGPGSPESQGTTLCQMWWVVYDFGLRPLCRWGRDTWYQALAQRCRLLQPWACGIRVWAVGYGGFEWKWWLMFRHAWEKRCIMRRCRPRRVEVRPGGWCGKWQPQRRAGKTSCRDDDTRLPLIA